MFKKCTARGSSHVAREVKQQLKYVVMKQLVEVKAGPRDAMFEGKGPFSDKAAMNSLKGFKLLNNGFLSERGKKVRLGKIGINMISGILEVALE